MSSSIREIARQTGVSTSAVSQALRGIGRISPATRARIREAADAAGYKWDPLLSKAFSRARQAPQKRYKETVALLLEWDTRTSESYQQMMHQGVLERANSLGYTLEPFVVPGKPAEHRRISRILRARGIRGVIIIPRLERKQPRLHLEWEDLAAVEIGATLWQPRNLHRVQATSYANVLEAIHLLKKVGYHRLGMAIEPRQNQHQNGVYYAAFLASQLRQPVSERIPIFAPTGPWDEERFRCWMEAYSPDVLFIHRIQMISGWLSGLGLRVPEDISLFCANAQSERLSGLRRDYAELGRSAVELLSLLLENGEVGLPRHPRCLRVDEIWQAGATLSRPIGRYLTQAGSLLNHAPIK